MLATEDIEMQGYNNSCSIATIINLFKLRGEQPPTFDEVNEGLYAVAGALKARQVVGDPDAPTLSEIQTYLATKGVLSGLVIIPPALWHTPQKVLTTFLDVGWPLLISYNWRDRADGLVISHITLAEGYDEKGYKVIDGQPQYLPEGSPIELEVDSSKLPDGIDAEWYGRQKHGSRMTLPFFKVCVMPEEPLGLLPHVLVVYPDER